MKQSLILAGFAAAVSASPLAVRQAEITDADILNYALTLEHLENRFYADGLANFTEADFAAAGFDTQFYDNIVETAADEATHVSFLTTALTAAGASPVEECVYAFPVEDVSSFIAVASILEGVGVSAYLGAAADIMSKAYLTAAGSILTIEARHSAYVRAGLNELPYPQPFDAPLTYNEVYSLAAQFIVSCPSTNVLPPLTAFPVLSITAPTSYPIVPGTTTVTATTPGYKLAPVDGTSQLYAAFVSVTGPIFTPVSVTSEGYTLTIPAGVNGQSYVVLSSCNTGVTDDTTLAVGVVEISNPSYAASL